MASRRAHIQLSIEQTYETYCYDANDTEGIPIHNLQLERHRTNPTSLTMWPQVLNDPLNNCT